MRRTPNRTSNIIPFRTARSDAMPRGPLVGRIIRTTKDDLLVDYPGNPHGPLSARSVVPPRALVRACKGAAQPEVILAFEEERSDRPVILGLLHPSGESGSSLRVDPPPEAGVRLEATVDGKRVVLEGQDEIVLKCGKAHLVMRRNGRIVMRGTFIEVDSEGPNHIKGGAVEIN